jgi:hypothetical protein
LQFEKGVNSTDLRSYQQHQLELIDAEYKQLVELALQEKLKRKASEALDQIELDKPILEEKYDTASAAINELLKKRYRL